MLNFGSKNPYLPQMGQAITQQVNNNLQQQVLPGIRSGATAVGGYGGSRQGIAEGLAIGQSNQGLSNSLANLYGQAYESDANRQLQQYGIDKNFDLGSRGLDLQSRSIGNQYALGQRGLDLQGRSINNQYSLGRGQLDLGRTVANQNYQLGRGNLDLGRTVAKNNFYTAQRGQDLQQTGMGADLFTRAMAGLGQQGVGMYGAGMSQFNAGALPYQTYANLLGPFTGLGGSTQTQLPGTSLAGGLLGGALGGLQLYNLFGG